LLKASLECRYVGGSQVGVGDEHIGGRLDGSQEIVSDIALPEAIVDDDGLLPKDGDLGRIIRSSVGSHIRDNGAMNGREREKGWGGKREGPKTN